MDGQYQLEELLDLGNGTFQQMQDNFAKAFDLGFIAVDYRGRPLIKYSGFTEFCNKIRKREECLKLCHQCDAHGGLQATITGEPHIYRCHAGLVDFAVPLIFGGKYMGAVMGGQVEFIGPAPELKPVLAQRTEWKDDPELVDAATRVHKATFEKLVASVYLLRDMVQSLMKKKYYEMSTVELEKKKRELREEREARIQLEEEMKKNNLGELNRQLSNDLMFPVLNVINRLAYSERAFETESAVCNFSDMLRYLMENRNTDFVTVGEELEYMEYSLSIHRYRLGAGFDYKINVPEGLRGILCPFLLNQALIANSLKYATEPVDGKRTLTVTGRADGNMFVLSLVDNAVMMTRAQIAALGLTGNGTAGKELLPSINRRIKEMFGDAFGVYIDNGQEVQVRLPLSSGEVG